MERQEILLETGTNEVEILEFYLGKQSFGVNVLKVKQILPYSPSSITPTPESYRSVLGTFFHQDRSIMLIDLKKHLKIQKKKGDTRQVVLLCEFNNEINGFLVDGVNRIHRIFWDKIHPAPYAIHRSESKITAIAYIQGQEMPLPDFEEVLGETMGGIEPFEITASNQKVEERKIVKILLAEDSRLYRNWMEAALNKAHFQNLKLFDNGLELFHSILAFKKDNKMVITPDKNQPLIIITDIEMPKMDGLTVCRKVKEEFSEIPVIIISSMVSEQIIEKCKEVSADAYVPKSQMGKMIQLIHHFCIV